MEAPLKLTKAKLNSGKKPYIEQEEHFAETGNGFKAQAFRMVQELILAGRNRASVIEAIKELRHNLGLPPGKPNYIIHLYDAGHQALTRDLRKERDSVISLHINRYNADIERLYNIDVSKMNKFRAQEVRTEAYLDLLDVMKQKERLLGFHKKETKIKINNIINTTIKKEGDIGTFDLSALTTEEKIELVRLIDRTKLSEEDLFFQSIGQDPSVSYYQDEDDKLDDLVEDIDFEDITDDDKDQTPIVDQIKKPDPIPMPPNKQPIGTVKNKLMAALMEANLKEGKNQKV